MKRVRGSSYHNLKRFPKENPQRTKNEAKLLSLLEASTELSAASATPRVGRWMPTSGLAGPGQQLRLWQLPGRTVREGPSRWIGLGLGRVADDLQGRLNSLPVWSQPLHENQRTYRKGKQCLTLIKGPAGLEETRSVCRHQGFPCLHSSSKKGTWNNTLILAYNAKRNSYKTTMLKTMKRHWDLLKKI